MFSITSFLLISTGFCCGVLMGWSVYPLMNGEKENIEKLIIHEMIMETKILQEEKNQPDMLDKAIQVELDKEVDIKDYFFVNTN
jgi:hypothetical protein